jgi:ADP-heptose:LPS heptosyltransferase
VKAPLISHPRRILVVQLRRLGDVVLTTALLEDLRNAFPDATVDFLVGDRAAPLLEHHPLIHERLVYARDHAARTWRAVRARRYDWIIDPQSSPRTAPLALLSGARVRAGFAVRGWGWVYTHRLARSGRPTEYVPRERQRLLELLGVPIGQARTRLALSAEERAAGYRLLERHGVVPDRPRVALVFSTGEVTREWPLDHFATLADALAIVGAQPVVFEMPGDAPRIARARQRARSIIQIPVPQIRDFMGALAASDVLVSADTGPAHIATALRTPRVTIYGPEVPAAWAPPNDPSVIALRAESARTLGIVPKHDPRASRLTAQVTPADVLDAVRALLARGPGPV